MTSNDLLFYSVHIVLLVLTLISCDGSPPADKEP